jgi:transcriptional regulator with XRE-family HTH domain
METKLSGTVHHGQNIKRLRDLLGIKQETIALGLQVSQQAMSKLEQKDQIEDELLGKVSEVLKVPVESIKNFDDKTFINSFLNTLNEASFLDCHQYQFSFNPLDKVVELYERLLRAEQEKNALLQQALDK